VVQKNFGDEGIGRRKEKKIPLTMLSIEINGIAFLELTATVWDLPRRNIVLEKVMQAWWVMIKM